MSLYSLDLCCGLKSWNASETLDIEESFKPTYCCDVRDFTPPYFYNVIFASPPCTYLSKVRAPHGYPPDKLKEGLEIFKCCLNMAKENAEYYLIENPIGKAKQFPGYEIIHYGAYGYRFKKPTYIWSNIPFKRLKSDKLFEPFQNGTYGGKKRSVYKERNTRRTS